MKRHNKFSSLLFALIAGAFIVTACNKDKNATPEAPQSGNYAQAAINFVTDNKKAPFSATGSGALAAIDKENVLVMILRDDNSPMGFLLSMQNAKIGTFSHEDGTLEGGGIFFADTAKSNIRELYFIGEDNIDGNDDLIDGKMTITISTISKTHITGTFSTTMVLNSTIYENGTLLEGEIKKAVVSSGKFNCGLVNPEKIE